MFGRHRPEAKRRASTEILCELYYRHKHHLEPIDAVELMAVTGWKKRPTNRLLRRLCKEDFLIMIPGEKSDGIHTADCFRINPKVIDTLQPYFEP